MYHPTAKSFFSGAGGMDLGLANAGIDIIQSVEIDLHASETLKTNFKHRVVTQDVKEMLVCKQEASDIIIGTYPCTKYSTIADIHGTRTGDDLALHLFRFLAIEQPEVYILENVPGMKKFKVIMEAMTKLPDYYVNVICPVNANNWLPQRRERLIIIGSKKPLHISPPAPSVNRTLLKDILEEDPQVEYPEYIKSRLDGKYRDKPIISDPDNKYELAPTCVSHYSKDLSTRLVKDKRFPNGVRPYSVREYARLQGFPDSFKFAGGDRQAYKQIGNAVPVHMAEYFGRVIMQYFN